jgi:hypothetical protein
MVRSRRGRRGLAWGSVAALALLPWPAAAAPVPLAVRYEAYVAGFPVVSFAFRLDETGKAYTLDGEVKTVGLLRLFYRLDLATDSTGTIAAGTLKPSFHEQQVRIRGHERMARLDYPGDGTVKTVLVPPVDAGRPKPTPQETIETLDPLSAILAIGRSVTATGRCDGRFSVFDGRRRYDLVLADDGTQRLEKSAEYGYAGEVRRCSVAAVKIAGFSWDQDYSPHTTDGRVWFAAPRPGAPALPVRIEFSSGWGFVSVHLTKIE